MPERKETDSGMPEMNYKTVKERITEKQQIRDNLILLKRQRKRLKKKKRKRERWRDKIARTMMRK